ncbi:MAG TPA: hypothetical protein VLH15_03200 [Dehalococcoidales bacterium]|nr:hypothetical protein [Dehalococcoidales bacterium]
MTDSGKDLTGEFFNAKTNFKSAYFDGASITKPIKALYHHGLDETIKDLPIGEVIDIQDTPEGKWMRIQLDKANKYYESIKRLVKAGKLLFSSGADPDNIKKLPNGYIVKWPLIEESLTFAPANPLAVCSFKALLSEIKDKDVPNMDQKEAINESKMVKSEGSPEIKPDPAVSAESNGHAAGEQKKAPPECPVKSVKCAHCGKAVELPGPVIAALNALIESAQSIVAQSQPGAAAPVEDATAAAPSQPGVDQEPPQKAEVDEIPDNPPEEEKTAVKSLLDGIETKIQAAVEEATKSLKERIATLESEPANNGPARRATKSLDNPKMGNETKQDRSTAIKAIMETTENQSLKSALGWELAQLAMNEVVANGPQSSR